MNVTTHERPGVYSVYGASSLVRGSGGRKTVGLAAVNTKAEAGVIQTITSYEEAVSTFGSQADSQDMAELIRVILLNGAAAVAVVPVANAEGYDAEQEELKAAARTKAEEILAEWKAGDATEDSFAKLAMEDSADGSKYTGGLYTRITKGQMVEAFNDWCFDSSRKSGDTDVVDTTYGSHVMYFVGTDLPAWAAAVTDNLQTEDTNKWNEELTKDAVTEQKDFGMKFVG